MFSGSITALVTPFEGERIDATAFRGFVKWQIEQGTHGLVPCGTTGEAPTLSAAEHARLVEICVQEAHGRIPVIAGAGSNNTAHALALASTAKKIGADAVLVCAPYYNKPSQDGLYAHFSTIADKGIPVILYNVPGRTIVDISVETMGRLARHEMIIGVKDATGDMGRVADQRAMCGDDFIQLSGDDFSALGFAAHGGRGCISVTSNVAPALCADMHNAMRAGQFDVACKINQSLQPLHRALFADASPTPTKYALSLMKKMAAKSRLPLVEASHYAKAAVQAAVQDMPEGDRS